MSIHSTYVRPPHMVVGETVFLLLLLRRLAVGEQQQLTPQGGERGFTLDRGVVFMLIGCY